MSDFEQELQERLRRVPAPPGVADHVMAHIGRKRRIRRIRRWTAAALIVAASITGVLTKQHREAEKRQEQAQTAARQLDLALSITANALNQVQTEIIAPNLHLSDRSQ